MFGAARALQWVDQRAYIFIQVRKVEVIRRTRLVVGVGKCEWLPCTGNYTEAQVISLRWLRPCPLYTPPVATTDWMVQWDNRTDNLATGNSWRAYLEDDQTWSFRGSKSRNKVSVGEPAEGSLLVSFISFTWELWWTKLGMRGLSLKNLDRAWFEIACLNRRVIVC